MEKKENQIDEDIRKAFGWEITYDQFRDDLELARDACGMADYFAQTANISQEHIFEDKLKNAEKKIELLEERGLSPFPLPFRVLDLHHASQIMQTEILRRKAEESFGFILEARDFWSNDNINRKPIVAKFYERFRNITKEFFGQEGGFLYWGTSQKINPPEKKEIGRILSENFGWKVTEEDLERNLQLGCHVSYWASKLAQSAIKDDSKDYQHCLDNANEQLRLLRDRGNPLASLPEGGLAIAQAIRALCVMSSAKIAYNEIHFALDQKHLLEGNGENRQSTLGPFYGEFKVVMRELFDLEKDVFHCKTPFEIPSENKDSWDFSEMSEEAKEILEEHMRETKCRYKAARTPSNAVPAEMRWVLPSFPCHHCNATKGRVR